MPIDFADSDWTDNVHWWIDRDGNEHAGMWDEEDRARVEGVIIELPDDIAADRGRTEDDRYAEYHGLRFSDEYTLDDFVDDIEDDERYLG